VAFDGAHHAVAEARKQLGRANRAGPWERDRIPGLAITREGRDRGFGRER
jgi:hypothetical protein